MAAGLARARRVVGRDDPRHRGFDRGALVWIEEGVGHRVTLALIVVSVGVEPKPRDDACGVFASARASAFASG